MLDGIAPCHDRVALHTITQATAATFHDLYVEKTFLFFIQSGSKRVVTQDLDFLAEAGDVVICSAGSVVTLENRPEPDRRYRAIGVSFPDEMVEAVFDQEPSILESQGVQHLPERTGQPADMLPLLMATLYDGGLPRAIRRHRLLEPLVWLREAGHHLSCHAEKTSLGRVRRVVEQDLSHGWRARDVALQLGLREATMGAWLAEEGLCFDRILLNARLERGLSLLQRTERSVSDIALSCGFATSVPFVDAFRRRFAIEPTDIRCAPV